MDLSKPILITWATGYIGSHFLSELLSQWATRVYCLTTLPESSEISPFWIECDIVDRSKVFEVFWKVKPSYIFHFAALWAKTTQSNFSLEEFLQVNTFGTQNLIDASIDSWVCEGFINISTAYEYWPQENPITEMTYFSPLWNYAISKFVGSVYLDEMIQRYWFPGITYRLFSVYGPGDSDRVIPLIVDALKTGKQLHLFDIHRKRDFVHRDTVISAVLKFDKIRKNNINSVNIWSWESISVYDLVHVLAQILNLPVLDNIIFSESTTPDTHWQCDSTLLKKYITPTSLSNWLLTVI